MTGCRCSRPPVDGELHSVPCPLFGCVFCDRVQQGEYDTERGSDEVVSFVPLNPVTRMHRLFVPKVHVPDALASPAVTGQVMAVAADYARQAGTPCNLVTSVGREATQSVFHLHVHYVPRFDGDGLHPAVDGVVVSETGRVQPPMTAPGRARKAAGVAPDVREQVAGRCHGTCEGCGSAPATEQHHRRPRAMGGTRRHDTNTAANLLALCGSCHRWAETHRADALALGWLVKQSASPRQVPVELHTPYGLELVLLTDDGSYRLVPST